MKIGAKTSGYLPAAAAFAVLSVICLQSCHGRAMDEKSDKERSQALSKSHFEFSLNLFRELTLASSSEEDVNFVFSPYCVNLALSMMFLGTRSASPTSNQFRKVLGYEGISYVDVHKAFKVGISF